MPTRWPARPNDARRGDAARHHARPAERVARAGQQAASGGARRGGRSLYETVLRQAIASQYRLVLSERQELRACDGCSKPYLLTSLWQPHADEGAIACPRCGTEAVSWDGSRGYVAYWHREHERQRDGLLRPPVPVRN